MALIGHQKGRDIKERAQRNFGMAYPEGYRKAMRVMELADRHSFPLLTLVDTPGAYPGIAAEQHGQGGAIARSQAVMARMSVPTVAVVIGEGGSGGAVAIALSDRVLMQENAIYSVISPEGCAAILWRDAGEKRKAAAAFKPDAAHCLELGVIDGIVPEPEGGAHESPERPRGCSPRRSASPGRARRDHSRGAARRRAGRSSARWASSPELQAFPQLPQAFPRSRIPLVMAVQTVEAGIAGLELTPALVENTMRAGAGCASDRSPFFLSSNLLNRYECSVASLQDYERKRSRKRTPEPFGKGKRGKAPTFVVQRHDARRLHYDFRLERDGVLLSWAVPKGVPLEPGTQHLAVHVEDHPLTYATFEGEIPAGNYGAGTVEIWDQGTYELVEEKPNGGMTVHLHGDKLNGPWTLVPAKLGGDPKNWLLVKKKTDEAPARKERSYWPMLATPADAVPSGEGWLHEVKWDGYRAIVTIAGGVAELTSRNGKSLTARFEPVARAVVQAVKTPDCVLDGEVCALDDEGRASFSAMQQGSGPLVLYLFDVLEIDGEPLVELPLAERHERLQALIDRRSKTVRVSDLFDDGDALFEAATAQKLEGIVSKRADSRYESGRRSRNWLKIKTQGRQELVVAGYTKGQGRRANGFGALVLGVNEKGVSAGPAMSARASTRPRSRGC